MSAAYREAIARAAQTRVYLRARGVTIHTRRREPPAPRGKGGTPHRDARRASAALPTTPTAPTLPPNDRNGGGE